MVNVSYWEKKHFFKADIIIIGSGIVGLNAAITIKQNAPKTSVFVLERGFLPTGASTKNAGFACFGSVSELIEQEHITGTEGLYRLISKRWQGLAKLKALLGSDKISYQNYGGYELFTPGQQFLAESCVAKLRHFNYLIADAVGDKQVFSLAKDKIKTFGFNAVDMLIENKLEAQIDTGLMMQALLAKAQDLGVKVYNSCNVKSMYETNNGINVYTEQGDFTCSKVLVATNAFVNELLPNMAVKPGRGQVIVTKPIKNLRLKGTFHYDRGYYYFRNIDDRILLGGGRNLDFETEQTTEFGETELVQNALQNLLREVILPDTALEIEQKWSGIMAFGPQLAPIISEVKPHIFCAVRCNGMGVAIGSQTGEEAGEMILESL